MLQELDASFARFAKDGPTAAELDNARKQVLNELETQEQEPRYWWAVLRHIDLHGWSLEELKNKGAAYKAFTVEQVRDAFRRYYTPARTFRVTTTPLPRPAAAPTTMPAAP